MLPQIEGHKVVRFSIVVRIGGSCKGDRVAAGILIVGELTVASHIESENVGRLLAVREDLLDHAIELRDQLAVRLVVATALTYQRPGEGKLLIARSIVEFDVQR